MFQAEEVEAVLANTKEILNQFLRKSRILLPTLIYYLNWFFLKSFSTASSVSVWCHWYDYQTFQISTDIIFFHSNGVSFSWWLCRREMNWRVPYLMLVSLTTSDIKQSYSLYFKPFKPLSHYSSILDKIEDLILAKDYAAAMDLSQNLRSLALQGLHYFQTYDWLMLMSIITLGYLGWMFYLVLHVLQSYTSLPGNIFGVEQAVQRNNRAKVMFV